jgi:hypothetical protein
MDDDEYSEPFVRRLGRAFGFQYNVILFFGALLYSAALASWVPALVAAPIELLWLLVGSSRATNRWIESRDREAGAATASNASGTEDLAAYALRFDALARVLDNVKMAKFDMTGMSANELGAALRQLEETQGSFTRLASLHQRLSQFLRTMPSADLELEIEQRTRALAAEKDLAVRMALRQSLGMVQRRLQHRELTANMLRAIDLRMSAIEQSFAYIESHLLNLGSALELRAEVDALVARVSSVDALEAGAGEALSSPATASRGAYPIPSVFGSG